MDFDNLIVWMMVQKNVNKNVNKVTNKITDKNVKIKQGHVT
jgi:hypothetical protein